MGESIPCYVFPLWFGSYYRSRQLTKSYSYILSGWVRQTVLIRYGQLYAVCPPRKKSGDLCNRSENRIVQSPFKTCNSIPRRVSAAWSVKYALGKTIIVNIFPFCFGCYNRSWKFTQHDQDLTMWRISKTIFITNLKNYFVSTNRQWYLYYWSFSKERFIPKTMIPIIRNDIMTVRIVALSTIKQSFSKAISVYIDPIAFWNNNRNRKSRCCLYKPNVLTGTFFGISCYHISTVGCLLDRIANFTTTFPEGPVPYLVTLGVRFYKPNAIIAVTKRTGKSYYHISTVGCLLDRIAHVISTSPEGPVPLLVTWRIRLYKPDITSTGTERFGRSCYNIPTICCLLDGLAIFLTTSSECPCP